MMQKTLVLFPLFLLALAPGCTRKPPDDGLKDFQGDWQFVSLNRNGSATAEDKLPQVAASFQKDTFQLVEIKSTGFEIAEKCQMRLDPSNSPPTIDLIDLTGAKQGMARLGIYSREGNELKICWADYGKARPSEFAGKREPAWTLLVLKRKE